MARPKKYNIDTEQVEKLASFGCSNTEIASFFGCSKDLISKSYSTNVSPPFFLFETDNINPIMI